MNGKYSPTVSHMYSRDQEWHAKQADDSGYDKEGYDSYGYNKDGLDRANHSEQDYMSDEELWEKTVVDWYFGPPRRRYLTLLRDDNIEHQKLLPPGLTNENVIELDTALREWGVIGENQEIAITEEIQKE